MTSRGWMITSFKEAAPIWSEDEMKYLVYQQEKCPTTEKLHWQAYVEMKNACRMAALKRIFGNEIHCQKRRGTPEEAKKYCTKEDSYIGNRSEFGKLPEGQGKRTDLKTVSESILKGASIATIACRAPEIYVKYHKGLEKLRETTIEDRNEMTELHIIWGESGSGKTRGVFEAEPDLYFKPEGKWWDGYENQKAVIIDDVCWNKLDDWIPHTMLLKLIDRYPLRLEYKGGFKNFTSSRIYITSMYNPEAWLMHKGLQRRITSVTQCNVTK